MTSPQGPQDVREVGTGIPMPDATAEPVAAWEQIAEGRYMPRRIRGSCLGRELG